MRSLTISVRRGLSFGRSFMVGVLRQVCRVDLVVVEYLVRLHDCGAAAQVLFHVKGVLLVKVGQVLVFRVLRYIEFVAEKGAYPS